MPFAAGYWALITVIAVANPLYDETLNAGRNQLAGTVLGGIVGIAVLVAEDYGVPLAPAFLAGLVPLAYVTGRWPNLRMACTTLIILTLIPANGSPYARALARFVEILIGVISSLIVARVLFARQRAALSDQSG